MDDLRNIAKIFTLPLDFINKYFKVFVFLTILALILASGDESEVSSEANLAKLYLNTPIFESESFQAQIERIRKQPNIKGVLLVINSPGGAVGASIEIADMIRELNEELPTIAYVQGSMASGSYYAGMYASEIYANRGALIGSIGVIFSGVNIKELMDKVGIKEQGIKAGEYKEVGTMSREWSEKERAFLDALLHEQYEMFYTDVIKARGKKLKSIEPSEFAEGKIFSAQGALELGLIDKVGTMGEAIEALMLKSGVKEPVWLKRDKLETYLEKILDEASMKLFSHALPSLKMSL